MNDLLITQTAETPEIDFKVNGELSLRGISTPEDTYTFYSVVFDWLQEFESHVPDKVKLDINLEYLNTSSNKTLAELVRTILKYKDVCSDMQINWLYDDEDEDAKELGEDIEYCSDAKFNFIPK
jgi:hypothetical protein